MSSIRSSLILLLCCVMASMSVLHASTYDDLYWQHDIVKSPTIEQFSVCSSHGCALIKTISITPGQWKTIQALFSQKAASAKEERVLIARAIAMMEQIVGPITETDKDRGGNTKGMFGPGTQMDCIDESTNTTSYLTLMDRAGLLQWHRAAPTNSRGFLFFWPHTTAAITEIATGQAWAVDSWFHDNGLAPEIIPMLDWKNGWKPPHY